MNRCKTDMKRDDDSNYDWVSGRNKQQQHLASSHSVSGGLASGASGSSSGYGSQSSSSAGNNNGFNLNNSASKSASAMPPVTGGYHPNNHSSFPYGQQQQWANGSDGHHQHEAPFYSAGYNNSNNNFGSGNNSSSLLNQPSSDGFWGSKNSYDSSNSFGPYGSKSGSGGDTFGASRDPQNLSTGINSLSLNHDSNQSKSASNSYSQNHDSLYSKAAAVGSSYGSSGAGSYGTSSYDMMMRRGDAGPKKPGSWASVASAPAKPTVTKLTSSLKSQLKSASGGSSLLSSSSSSSAGGLNHPKPFQVSVERSSGSGLIDSSRSTPSSTIVPPPVILKTSSLPPPPVAPPPVLVPPPQVSQVMHPQPHHHASPSAAPGTVSWSSAPSTAPSSSLASNNSRPHPHPLNNGQPVPHPQSFSQNQPLQHPHQQRPIVNTSGSLSSTSASSMASNVYGSNNHRQGGSGHPPPGHSGLSSTGSASGSEVQHHQKTSILQPPPAANRSYQNQMSSVGSSNVPSVGRSLHGAGYNRENSSAGHNQVPSYGPHVPRTSYTSVSSSDGNNDGSNSRVDAPKIIAKREATDVTVLKRSVETSRDGLKNDSVVVASNDAVVKSGNSSSSSSNIPVTHNYNPEEFDLNPKNGRFFIIKSYSEDDIHRSIKYSIWCSTEHGNKRLDVAFKSQSESNGSVFLFFSVNGSGHFCGMAQMTSPVDYNSTSNVWAQDKWKGQFKVKWIYVKDVPNSQLRHIKLENNENKPVTNSRDTQEVPPEKGRAVLKIIHSFKHSTSIFDDFNHYEKRQQEESLSRKSGHESSEPRSLPPSAHSARDREAGGRQQDNRFNHDDMRGNNGRDARDGFQYYNRSSGDHQYQNRNPRNNYPDDRSIRSSDHLNRDSYHRDFQHARDGNNRSSNDYNFRSDGNRSFNNHDSFRRDDSGYHQRNQQMMGRSSDREFQRPVVGANHGSTRRDLNKSWKD